MRATKCSLRNVDVAPAVAGPHAAPLTAAASGSLIALAHTGSPGNDQLPPWPRYDSIRRATMIMGDTFTIEEAPADLERRSWDAIELTGLGPLQIS